MNKEETSRRFYTTPHPFDCGIDLHARTLYIGILAQGGEVLVHRNMTTAPEAFLKAMAPYRPGLVVAVDCRFPWYWLADLCADAGLPFVLGHARSMKASHGGKATNDKSDAQKIAPLLRGGRLPPAAVSPAQLRPTRELLRRRMPLPHKRAALRAPMPKTNSQSPLPALGKKIADQANRDGIAERLAAAAVPKSSAVALALLTSDDARRRDVARSLVQTARHHEAPTRYLLPTVPGIGKMCSRVLLYESHDIERFPRGQACVSSGRLVNCRKASTEKRDGTSGPQIGQAHLTWAFSAAAVLCLRDQAAAPKSLARLAPKQGQGHALTVLAQQLARAGYSRRKRQVAFETETFCQR
jgi:transposase